eukprot:TRINITY_DN5205_c0_g1_i3.p1 TRINITY_DN5205_c0_g1~~TRINITY_DN5205_c0_g1_i3.p1  ORF type:complete len:487 (+),score=95.27 TRINITY_DN5205_c0_g1_i3:772-2232(+)
MEKVVAFMYTQKAHFKQSFDFMESVTPLLAKILDEVSEERETYISAKEAFIQKMESHTTISDIAREEKHNLGTSYEGFLYKRTESKSLKSWKKRYFKLEDGTLNYFHNANGKEPDGVINLALATVKPNPNINRNFVFEVVSPYSTFVLQAEDEAKMNMWIAILENAIAHELSNDQQNLVPVKRSNFNKRKSLPPVPTRDNLRRKKRDSASATMNKSYLEDLYQIEGNRFCADCKFPNPTWASINLGILLCLDCCGVHRNLGVHISKARSFSLDNWNTNLVNMMKQIGNDTSNTIYEYKLPPDERIDPDSDNVERSEFIYNKYVLRQWMEVIDNGVTLEQAISTGNLKRVVECTTDGYDINESVTDKKLSYLHIASEHNQTEILEYLILNGANLSSTDINGNTPLHHSIKCGSLLSSALLLLRAADINLRNNEGESPLDLAIKYEDADAVTLLRLTVLARETEGEDFDESLEGMFRDYLESVHQLKK